MKLTRVSTGDKYKPLALLTASLRPKLESIKKKINFFSLLWSPLGRECQAHRVYFLHEIKAPVDCESLHWLEKHHNPYEKVEEELS